MVVQCMNSMVASKNCLDKLVCTPAGMITFLFDFFPLESNVTFSLSDKEI